MTARPHSGSDPAPAAHRAAPRPIKAVATFETFYRRELKSVTGLAYALSGSRLIAEDLAQEAFLAAHRNWKTVGRYDKPEAWVRRVVANMAVSQFRRRMREVKAVALLRPQSSYLPALPSDGDEFWRAVRALPRRQAQAVALFYLEDLPVAEIAEILECAESTVKVHLHKARERLARTLGATMGGDD